MSTGFILGWCVIWGLIGLAMGSGRPGIGAGVGAFLGVLLGPIGLLIIATSKTAEKEPATVLDRIERTAEAPGWHADPLGRFPARWWDGERWTQHVGRVEADGSRTQLEDPV